MWKYEFSEKGIRALEKMDSKTASLLEVKIKNIGNWLDNKENLHVNIKRLKGKWEGFYRLRAGKIRVILTIDDKNELIRIYDIGFRRDVYK